MLLAAAAEIRATPPATDGLAGALAGAERNVRRLRDLARLMDALAWDSVAPTGKCDDAPEQPGAPASTDTAGPPDAGGEPGQFSRITAGPARRPSP